MASNAGFTPTRLVSKDGETVVVVTRPQQFNDLHFGAGYRIAEDQDNLEPDPTAQKLDNGKLVDRTEETEEAETPAAVIEETDTKTAVDDDDAGIATVGDSVVAPSTPAPKAATKSSAKASAVKSPDSGTDAAPAS